MGNTKDKAFESLHWRSNRATVVTVTQDVTICIPWASAEILRSTTEIKKPEHPSRTWPRLDKNKLREIGRHDRALMLFFMCSHKLSIVLLSAPKYVTQGMDMTPDWRLNRRSHCMEKKNKKMTVCLAHIEQLRHAPLDFHEAQFPCCALSPFYRLSPSVPFTSRTLDKDTVLGDYAIPKGVSGLYAIHLTWADYVHLHLTRLEEACWRECTVQSPDGKFNVFKPPRWLRRQQKERERKKTIFTKHIGSFYFIYSTAH